MGICTWKLTRRPSNKLQFASVTLMFAWCASAQGTLLFSNRILGEPRRINASDGSTALTGLGPYLVDLVVEGAAGLTDASTGIELKPLKFFKSSFNAGLFPGTIVIANGLPPGPDVKAIVTVRAWDTNSGATYDSASVRGSVSFTQIGFGGFGSPASDPFPMTGFNSFALHIGDCHSCSDTPFRTPVIISLTSNGAGTFQLVWKSFYALDSFKLLYSTNLSEWVEHGSVLGTPFGLILHTNTIDVIKGSPIGYFRVEAPF